MKATQQRRTRGPKTVSCSVDGCERSGYAKGYCRLHYRRAKDSPRGIGPVGLLIDSDQVKYAAAHYRLLKQRGRASAYQCSHCGDAAVQWAYDHKDPNERIGTKGGYVVAYSLDASHYLPLCHSCHRRFDKLIKKENSVG